MEIVNFFETLAGKWFSLRTTHYLANQQSQAGQSNLLIEWLPHTDSALIDVCQQLGQDPGAIACGLRVNQDSRLDGETKTTQSSTLMVALKPGSTGEGVLVQSTPSLPASQGEYRLEHEVLTFTTQTSAGRLEERLWYLNPNLRMRTSVVKMGDQVQITSFCSEIRMGLTQNS
ncbi:MAG: phycobiliprotein lyase [Nodosilinea sp.]